MKAILQYNNKNTVIATLKQLCSIKCTTQHITKTKAEEQGKRRVPTNDENKEDETVPKSLLKVLRFNNWKRTDIAQSENLNEQNKPLRVGRKKSVKLDPRKRN